MRIIRPCGANILGITHTDDSGFPYDPEDAERTNLSDCRIQKKSQYGTGERDSMKTNSANIDFRSCGNLRCRRNEDGNCQNKAGYEKCSFGDAYIKARSKEREKKLRRDDDCCGNCAWFDGEPGDWTQFCDMRELWIKESEYCVMHKRKESQE